MAHQIRGFSSCIDNMIFLMFSFSLTFGQLILVPNHLWPKSFSAAGKSWKFSPLKKAAQKKTPIDNEEPPPLVVQWVNSSNSMITWRIPETNSSWFGEEKTLRNPDLYRIDFWVCSGFQSQPKRNRNGSGAHPFLRDLRTNQRILRVFPNRIMQSCTN